MQWQFAGYGIGEEPIEMRLITSDGAQYGLYDVINEYGNHIKDTDLNDLELRRSGSEYPGAVYGLYHKDGKMEYFDERGRNIAILDRFGNAITIAYTYKDASRDVVTKMEITDTLGNLVVYEEVYVAPGVSYVVPGKTNTRYNSMRRLSLNGQTVREYFAYTSRTNLGSTSVAAAVLNVVKDENGQTTLYRSNVVKEKFNCFLSSPAPNDSDYQTVELKEVTFPNGYTTGISRTSGGKARIGAAGYRYATQCWDVTEQGNQTTRYTYGDYSNLSGLPQREEQYQTKVQKIQMYPEADASGALTGNRMLWWRSDEIHTFNLDGQTTSIHKTSYNAPPGYGDKLTMDQFLSGRQTWESQTVSYGYASSSNGLPSSVYTNYRHQGSTSAMTQSEHYTYDSYGNVLTYTKPNGQQERYTYDGQYSILTGKQYSQDAATQITVTNTLSSDGKTVLATETKRNGASVAKSAYRYDTAGRLVGQDDYTSATECITVAYDYGSGALPEVVAVAGVKNSGGGTAVGTPTFPAGTIAQRNTYNTRGWVTSQTDAGGNTTALEYDPTGRVTKVTHPDGAFATYSYNIPNNTVTFTDENGGVFLYTYNTAGKLLTVTDLQTNTVLTSNEYDRRNRLVFQTTHGTPQQKTYYRYDTDDRVIETGNLDPQGNVLYQKIYQYLDGEGKRIKKVMGDADAPSVVTTSYVDNMGNVVKTGRLLDGTEYFDTYAYDYVGNQTQSKTAYTASLGGSYTAATTYDHAGRPLSITNSLGQTVSKGYDWLGRQTTDTDPAGTPTTYTYDALGRLLRISKPLDSGRNMQTDYAYDPNGNLLEERVLTAANRARVTRYEYDAMNRLTLVEGNAREEGASGYDGYSYTQYYYDAMGNILRRYTGQHAPLTITGLDQVTTSGYNPYSTIKYTYDRFGNVLTETDPLGQTETSTYNAVGQLLTHTDRNGNLVTNTYDAMGRLTASAGTKRGYQSDTLTYTYTKTGQRKSASSNGDTTTYTYDALGRPTTETGPFYAKTFTYNIGDLRTNFTVTMDGKTVLDNTYTYDPLGRMASVNGSGVAADYTYDTNGNLASTEYNNGVDTAYSYNPANLPTQVSHSRGSANVSQYNYSYGLDGNQTQKTDNQGSVTDYSYDGMGRLKEESESGASYFTNSYSYDASGNREYAQLSNREAVYTYNAANRLTYEEIVLDRFDGFGCYASHTYTYDNQGNLTQDLNSAWEDYDPLPPSSAYVSYQYDRFNRLKSVGDNGVQTAYTYGADGLRSTKTTLGVVTQYIWDNGQLVYECPIVPAPFLNISLLDGNPYQMLVWGLFDAYPNFWAVIDGTAYNVADYALPRPRVPGWEYSYLFDIAGVSFEVDNADTLQMSSETDRNVQLYWQAPEEVSAVNPASKTYIRGLGLIASVAGSAKTYYLYNAHGDVVQLTNENGTVLKSYAYDAFGVEQSPSATDPNPFRYAGEYYDSGTGTYYLRARNYDPTTGRFLSEDTHWSPGNMIYGDNPQKFQDPLGLNTYTYRPDITAIMQSGNKYTYALNNPIMYRDPGGNVVISTAVLILLGIGTAGAGVYTGASIWVHSDQGQAVIQALAEGIVDGIASAFSPNNSYSDSILEVAQASISEMKDPDPHAREGQKEQGREKKYKAREKENFKSHSNKRRGPEPPKHHTPGKDHRKEFRK